ncbi:MAG TPA: hypothetical protein VGG56_07235 [Terracidiphilus sp.]|jgi:hypothetical protein
MYCSGCGQALAPGQPVCAQCGHPVAPVVPSVPGLQFQLENYSGKVKALSVVWFLYAVYSLLVGVAGLNIAHAFIANHFGNWGPHSPWNNGSGPPEWLGPFVLHFIWVAVLVRAGLALLVAWGLHERSQWGRIVAIVVAFLDLLKFPVGTALGIWTLVVLLGYRNSTLYEQLGWQTQPGPNR